MQKVNQYALGDIHLYAQNKNLFVGNQETIILDNLQVMGLSSFNLIINNNTGQPTDTITQVSIYAREDELEDYYLIKDNVFPYTVPGGEIQNYSFSVLVKTLRITAVSSSNSNLNVYMHGNPN